MEQDQLPQQTRELPAGRDIFLSHRSVDKEFVRKLAADIEAVSYKDRNLLTWIDEAEIPPGRSITEMVNAGLENSRFIGLVLTPDYFQSESGWTDAEWHAALFADPDNRRARVIPILAKDCPYIPPLLRHLKMIDLREERYSQGLKELIMVLREEPLPRPIPVRGQLVTPGRRIDRATLLAERAIPDADPDVVKENLSCNLLPVEKLPEYVYTASISRSLYTTREDGTQVLPTKQRIKEEIVAQQGEIEHPIVPAFRIVGDRIVTFHDLESSDSLFISVIDTNDVEAIPTEELIGDEDSRRVVVSLLNMALDRHAHRLGLVIDKTKHGRFFFPPKDGTDNVITWFPYKKASKRSVAKRCLKNGQVVFWRHHGAYLRIFFLANRFYLQIKPTWVLTEDGYRVKGGPGVGRQIIKWTGAERNLQILYHVRFWTQMLRDGRGPISIKAGDQWLTIATTPAFVNQAYGIANDQKNVLDELDQIAGEIAVDEEQMADLVTELEISAEHLSDEQVLDVEEDVDNLVEGITEEDERDEQP
jgi:hypothetical protein